MRAKNETGTTSPKEAPAMPNHAAADSPVGFRKSTLFLVLLTGAGLAGNHFNFRFLLDIHFLFGSIFALLVLQFQGILRGVLAGAIIAGYTVILYHHPGAMTIMTAEVAVVGLLVLRRRMSMVLADTCYWLFIGIPSTFLIYHLLMQVPLGTTTITMAKWTVNGIANALIARLVFMGYSLYSRSAVLSYREIVHNLFSFFVLFPSLIILAVSSRSDSREMDRAIRTSLVQDTQRIDKLMDTWVLNRKQAITVLADTLVAKSPREIRSYLALATRSDSNFRQISFMDREAEVVAFFPPPGETGDADVGLNLAERRYVPRLKETLSPMLSEVSLVWSGTPGPRVAMLAPVVNQGAYEGYVCGVISLNQTRSLLDKFTEHTEKLYTLSDRNGRVIMTNRPEERPQPPTHRGKGFTGRISDLASRLTPVRAGGIGIFEGEALPSYRSEIQVGDLAEWKLTLEQPVAPFQRVLYSNYTGKLTLVLLVLVASLGLAELLARWIMKNLERLLEVTRSLPARLASGVAVDWPETTVLESMYLIGNFREMADSLKHQFGEIRAANESLALQTALLKESEEKYRLLFDSANDAILITDTDSRILEANPQAIERLGYSQEELRSMTGAEIESGEDGERLKERQARLMNRGSLTFETLHKGRNGSLMPTEVSARLIIWDHRPAFLSVCRDITERKQAYQSRLSAMRDLIGAIAHQWRQPLSTLGMIIQRTHALGTMQGLTPEYLDDFKANAMRQVRYMSDTIEEFRNFYRPDKERQAFSPVACINDALQLLEAQLNQHAIAVRLDAGGGVPLVVVGVPNEFKQVILNLLGNARDAILQGRQQPGSPEKGLIDIKVERTGTGLIRIEVSDNGCGIADEVEPKLFTPHFTTKREQGGTGIGLYMSKMIIEESMGGTLSFRRDVPAATFRIELPEGRVT